MQKKIKELLKKIFPLTLLRQVQTEITKLRSKTIDKWRFPEKVFQDSDFVIRRDDYPFRVYAPETTHLPPQLRKQFEQDNLNWTQDEYLLIYDQQCIIEPSYGWALSANNELIYPSLGFSRAPHVQKPKSEAKSLRKADVAEYPELISLRDTGEENYYHFYNDVLAKLFFLEEKLAVSKQVPVLVSKRLYDQPFFQYFLAHPYLHNRTWIVQEDNQYICSQRTYFCKPFTHTPHYYRRILSLVRPEDLEDGPSHNRRVFITRNPNRLRFIENNAQIIAICQELDFEVVDFDRLTFTEQIRLMSQARYVVGIHGAGLTNMLFRYGSQMSLLEIYPPADYFPFHYILMANQLGYYYDGMVGLASSRRFSGGFYVDPTNLKQQLTALLEH